MVKILFYSKNKKSADIVSKILKNSNYKLLVQNLAGLEKYSNNPGGAELAIFDMSDPITGGKSFNNIIESKDTASLLNGIGTIKLIICRPGCLKALQKAGIKMDDFIFYPNIEDELSARVEFLLSKNKRVVSKNSIVVDAMVLNPDKYELTVNKTVIELTYKEFELLKTLLQNQNIVLTRNNLFSNVWDYDFYGGSRTVDVHIRRLRSKLPPPYNLMIRTIRNVGYLFSPTK